MSQHRNAAVVPEKFDPKHSGKLPQIFLGAAAVGLLGSLAGWKLNTEIFPNAYLFGFMVCFLICIGFFFWTCLHHATDSEWGILIRRQMENGAVLFPILAVLFIPVLLFADKLWPWWTADFNHDPLLKWKEGYLNKDFFFIRAAFFFVALSTLGLLMRGLSVSQDKSGNSKNTLIMRKLGVVGIPVVALSATFSGYDWLIGMFPNWFSTMWGVYLFAGAVGSSMAVLVIIINGLQSAGYLKPVTAEHYHIMGKFLLAFTIFWAYIGYSQYMLIWYANIPEETVYYINRNTGNWWYLSTALVWGRFIIPLPILLQQWIKKKPELLKYAAAWIILMEILDLFIIVLPGNPHLAAGFTAGTLLTCVFPLLLVGGVLGTAFLKILSSSNTFPTRDPRLAGSVKLSN